METEKITYILTPGASKSLKPTIDALVKASPKEFRALSAHLLEEAIAKTGLWQRNRAASHIVRTNPANLVRRFFEL
jgi:hypothetical protein